MSATNETQIAYRDSSTVQRAPSLLDPGTLEQARQLAGIYRASGMVPNHLNEAAIIVGLGIAYRSGQDALWVLQNLYSVSGTYGWSAKYLIAQINGSGRFTGPVRFEVTGTGASLSVTAWAKLAADGERVESTVSLAIAKRAGWTRNKIYNSIPEQMLSYRAATFLCRLYCPEVLCGLYTSDELQDIRASRGQDSQPEQRIEVVEPAPVQAPQLEAAPEPETPWQERAEAHLLSLGVDLETQARLFGAPSSSWGDTQREAIRALARKLQSGETNAADVCSVTLDAAPEVIEAAEVAAEPEPEPERRWSKGEAAAFQGACKTHGLSYDEAADTIEAHKGSRPSARTAKQRAEDIGWLLGDSDDEGGPAAYSEIVVARELTLEAARALTHGDRAAAAEAAGVQTRSGKTLTAPGSMSLVQLRALLGAHDLAGEE